MTDGFCRCGIRLQYGNNPSGTLRAPPSLAQGRQTAAAIAAVKRRLRRTFRLSCVKGAVSLLTEGLFEIVANNPSGALLHREVVAAAVFISVQSFD